MCCLCVDVYLWKKNSLFLFFLSFLACGVYADLSEDPANVSAFWDSGFLPLYSLSQNMHLHRRRTTTHVEYEDTQRWSHSLCLAIELGQNALALHDILESCPWPVAVLIAQKTRQRVQAWIGATRRREAVEEGIHWVFASHGGVQALLDVLGSRQKESEEEAEGEKGGGKKKESLQERMQLLPRRPG